MNFLDSMWKYKIITDIEDWQVVEEWCNQQFGEFGERWYKMGIDPGQWYLTESFETIWLFKTEPDAVLFKLRWA